jgi:hypothetical protein
MFHATGPFFFPNALLTPTLVDLSLQRPRENTTVVATRQFRDRVELHDNGRVDFRPVNRFACLIQK